MNFYVRRSYNLDLLNFMNILTGEKFYCDRHPGIYECFGEKLSSESKERIKEAVQINGIAMLGPLLILVISAVSNFEKRSILRMFEDSAFLESCMKQYQYYDQELWSEKAPIFDLLMPVIQELEENGFRSYWQGEKLPGIKKVQRQLGKYAKAFQLYKEIELML